MESPIDVTIYIQKLDDSETINELINEVSEKEEIKNKAKLKEVFLNKMEMKAMENFAEFSDPVLNEEQFNSSLMEALVEVTLDELIAMGLVMADFDPEKGENVYDLTPEHRKSMEENGGE